MDVNEYKWSGLVEALTKIKIRFGSNIDPHPNQVWFKHVPTPNFLLADSFPVHTAQTTQKLLLQVGHCPSLKRWKGKV